MRQLTIVPDRELNRVPFAALWDRVGNRFVIEDYVLRTVPSAEFFIAALSRPHPAAIGSRALVVGDPKLDPASAAALPPLAGAAREAESVARIYAGATLLRGADAAHARVVELMPAHSVFHFAGHAVFNAEQPELSYLALASDGGAGTGILRAREIGDLRLSNVAVVVLSACSSSSPRASRTGAITGLAYSFLRAGVPATISTVWDVEDDTAAEVVVRFHRHLAAGAPTAEALRSAQLEALNSARPELAAPDTWAAFTYTGP
jgi:CHAT domain-containing protein